MEHPELSTIEITKQQLDYLYVVPTRWSHGLDGLSSLVGLSRELELLLLDLTGDVMVRKLRSIPLLRDAGLFSEGSTP